VDPDEPEPLGEREQLIEEIAALDEAHAAGSLEEDVYASQRARLKDRLLSLTGTEVGRLEGRLDP
jgi:hypothetical protein